MHVMVVVARPILVVGNNVELWAIIAEVGPGIQTVRVMGSMQ